ncbi:SusC/RagA family TonB-linked outer membrane protein, partial [Bacteroides cellulosilyticus]
MKDRKTKNLRTMRALCLSLFLSVSLSLFSQITVTVENTPLRAALKKIEQVSDYKFFYNEKLAGLDQAVTFSVSNATIAQTMQKVLAGKELTYKMESDNVVVLLHKEAVSQKTKTITGTIVDSSGEPVIGASIVVKGTTNGTITDVDGNYSLSNVPENSTVSISYIGYQPLSYPASSKELSRVILKEDAEMLDEVIVVGYGTTKKANLSGAVDQISSKEIEHRVSGNAGQVLQGMIPNLNVSFSDGSINSKASFDVRGVGSINGGSPLVLIDGVEGDMNYINPKDIESISVLKDASSAAIYGARAAFGVVLITTKNPNAGKIQVNYSNHFGWSNPTINTDNFITDGLEWARLSDKLSLLENTSTYLGYTEEDYAYMEARKKDPSLPSTLIKTVDGVERYVHYGNTDWWHYIFQDNQPSMEHNLNISGGSEKVRFYLSGRFYSREGIYRINPDKLKSYTLRSKIDFQLTSAIKITNSTNIYFSDYDYPATNNRNVGGSDNSE